MIGDCRMKILLCGFTLLLTTIASAGANECISGGVFDSINESACITVEQAGPKEFMLYSKDKLNNTLTDQMRMTLINWNNFPAVKFEVVPLNQNEPIKFWKTINASNGKIIENELYMYEPYKRVDNFMRILLSQTKTIISTDLPSACKDAAVFCPLGAILSVTIYFSPLAIYGCTDLLLKCSQQSR